MATAPNRIIGISETGNGRFRLTFNGVVLGDSRGMSRSEAEAKARAFVASNPIDGRWCGSEWVEFRNVLAAGLSR